MRPLRISFTDFHSGFNPPDNRIWRALSGRFELSLVAFGEPSDLLVYSDFGESHWGFKGLKVYVTGENMLPDFGQCDLAFTPFESPDEPRAVRMPYYAQVLPGLGSLVRPPGYDARALLGRGKFCSFVASATFIICSGVRSRDKPILMRLCRISSRSILLPSTRTI